MTRHLMSTADYNSYRKNHNIAKQACASFVDSIYFTEASKGQRVAMLITMRSMLSSYTFTDYMTCRKAVELSGIGKTTYAEARQLMLQSGFFAYDFKTVNRRRFQLMLTPKVLGQPQFIKNHIHEQFYQNRFYNFNSKSDIEFIKYLNSENDNPFIFDSEKPDTINHKSVLGSSAGVSLPADDDSCSLPDVYESDLKIVEKNKTIFAENSPFWQTLIAPKGESVALTTVQDNRLELAKYLELVGLRCFPVMQNSKQMAQSSSIKNLSKEYRLRKIYKTEFARNFGKSDVDKGLMAWMGEDIVKEYGESEDDYKAKVYGRWCNDFLYSGFLTDLGAFMGNNLVCLDCDDEDTFKVVLGIMPENVIAQKTKRGGHIFVKDSRMLLKNVLKVGNIDILQGNKSVKVWDEVGTYELIKGNTTDLYNLEQADLVNFRTYLLNGHEIVLSANAADEEKNVFAEVINNRKLYDIAKLTPTKAAMNVIAVLKGKDQPNFQLKAGMRNFYLFCILSSLRAMGYNEAVLSKAAALLYFKYFEQDNGYYAERDKCRSTLKSVLKGTNTRRFEQKVKMFSVDIKMSSAVINLEL